MENETNASTAASLTDAFEVTGGLIFTNILISILAVLTVGGNALTITAFMRNSSLRTNPQSNRHIMSLATADLGVGLIPLPLLVIINILDRWPFGVQLCMVKSIVEGGFLIVTIFTIVFISYDRYLLVHREYPVYLETQTKLRVNIQIAFTWIFSAVTMTTNEIVYYKNVGIDVTSELYCNFHTIPETLPNLFLLSILLFIPMSVIAVCNLNTFLNIRKRIMRRRRIGIIDDGASATVNTIAVPKEPPVSGDDTLNSSDNKFKVNLEAHNSEKETNFKRRYVKPAVMMGVLLSTFLVCWAPLGITGVLKNFMIVFSDSRHWKWIHLIMYTDSVFNPILYAITNKKIRIAMKKSIGRK